MRLESIKSRLGHYIKNQRGQGLTEYAFLFSLVVVVAIFALSSLGTTTASKLSNSVTTIVGAL